MDTSYLGDRLAPLYNNYNKVIKPLIAEIEVRFESFPTSIFNEIRAYNDHVARCFLQPNDEEWINTQIRKAEGHIERLILDCYKFLNVSLYDLTIKKFDKKYKGVDLSVIDDGMFIIKHRKLVRDIVINLKKAKLTEGKDDKAESIAIYQDVHNKYTELENLIDTNCRTLFWAKGRFYTNKVWKFLCWLAAAIISGVISSCIIPYDKLMALLSY